MINKNIHTLQQHRNYKWANRRVFKTEVENQIKILISEEIPPPPPPQFIKTLYKMHLEKLHGHNSWSSGIKGSILDV